MFQLTAARRRLEAVIKDVNGEQYVSTHSRPKAAGVACYTLDDVAKVSTHSRPKAAGVWRHVIRGRLKVSTHSRPKAAGRSEPQNSRGHAGFNSQPPEGGWAGFLPVALQQSVFQLTAARRRLAGRRLGGCGIDAFQLTAARRRLAK